MPASCGVGLNSGGRLTTNGPLLLRQRRLAARQRAGLHDEAGHDAVERRAVVDAELGQAQEVADVAGRAIREELHRDLAHRRLEHGAIAGELRRRLGLERRRLGRRRVADPHRRDLDAVGDQPVGVGRHLGDLLRDLEALDDPPEHRELAVEGRLIRDADEELRAGAVRLARPQHRRHRAAHVLEIVGAELQDAEAAGPVLRLLRRILRQRIAALDQAAQDGAMEGGAVVGALLGQLHQVADMVGRGVGQQLDHDVAEAGRDHRLLVPHLLDGQRRRVDARRAGRRTARLGCRRERRPPDSPRARAREVACRSW